MGNAPAIIGDLPPCAVVFFLKHGLAPIMPERTPFFMPHPVSPDRIWSDDNVRAIMSSDEVKKMRLSAGSVPFCLGTAVGLLDALEAVQKDVIPSLEVPYSVCHGMMDYGVKVEGTEYLVKHVLTKEKDKHVNFVDGAMHDLLSDPKRY